MKYYEELKAKLIEAGVDESKVAELVDFSKKSVPKEFVPNTVYKEKTTELENVSNQLNETTSKIEELKTSADTAESLKTQLSELKTKNDEFKNEAEARVSKVKKELIMRDKLVKAGADANNLDLLMYDVNNKMDDLKLDGEDISNADELIKDLKTKRSVLFSKTEIGSNSNPEDNTDPTDETDFSELDDAMGI